MIEVFLLLVCAGIIIVMSLSLSPSELVTRFSFRDGHVFRKDKRDKRGTITAKGEMIIMSALFDPYPVDNKASISRISRLDNRSIWFIGKVVEKIRKEKGGPESLKGRADIIISKIHEIGLTVVPDEPPPKHANIEGYISESEEYNAQQKLANYSEGYLVRDENPSIENILNENTAVSKLFKEYT